ncbi:MAG TPA: PilZ domain-containing protein [Sedimentisphaerales bacterium]|jgi:esterase/lipase superfamily enzyme|nr:PilZ domain-containing protein [Sedimentisphaerales bacterium]HNU28708.1 PilZ domain-containing protein [Sedimentisphaerales bacterium]
MSTTSERRMEQRLYYHWPVWFAPDVNGELSQGQMADLSSRGAAFTCYADDRCPHLGQHLTARFSIPQYGQDDSFDMVDFVRSGHVCRVDGVNNALRRIAIQFFEPLPMCPGEQAARLGQSDDEVAEPELALV